MGRVTEYFDYINRKKITVDDKTRYKWINIYDRDIGQRRKENLKRARNDEIADKARDLNG